MKPVEKELAHKPFAKRGKSRPAECVSWYDAAEFCQRLSRHTGRDYHLPSEEQWEYACRAGTTTPFYVGETITTDLANYRGKASKTTGDGFPCWYGQGPTGKFRAGTTKVGSFPPNDFGLYDMAGNVDEWCLDPHHEKLWEGFEYDHNIVRGGSFLCKPNECRSAWRDHMSPDGTNFFVGFRVCCSF